MAYTPNPLDSTQPADNVDASTAAAEFRALKAYLLGLVGLPTGQNLYRKNAIIGGDFSINPWQRGTSFVGVATNSFSADRWKYIKTSAAVHDITKVADAPTFSQANRLTNDCLQVNCTTADAAVAAGDYVILQQNVEGFNFLPIAQNAMAFSFWHKHSKPGIHCVSFLNSGSDRSYVAEYAQTTADTWEYSTVLILGSPSGGTWDYTTGAGLRVCFPLQCGTTFQCVANAWQVGEFYGSNNIVNDCDAINNKFALALVQLEKGGAVSSFEERKYQEELILCQRYLPAWNVGVSVGDCIGAGQNYTAVNSLINLQLPVNTRVAPTGITISAAGDFCVSNAAGGNVACTAVAFNFASRQVLQVATTVGAGLVAGNATMFMGNVVGANKRIYATGCEI